MSKFLVLLKANLVISTSLIGEEDKAYKPQLFTKAQLVRLSPNLEESVNNERTENREKLPSWLQLRDYEESFRIEFIFAVINDPLENETLEEAWMRAAKMWDETFTRKPLSEEAQKSLP